MGYRQTLEAIAAELRGALPWLPSHDRRDAQAFLDLVVDAIEREKNAVVLTTVGGFAGEQTKKIYANPVIDARLMRREGLRRMFPVPRPEAPPPAAPAKPPLEHRYLREGEPEVQEPPWNYVKTQKAILSAQEEKRRRKAELQAEHEREVRAAEEAARRAPQAVRARAQAMLEAPRLAPPEGWLDRVPRDFERDYRCALTPEEWAAVEAWNAVEEEDEILHYAHRNGKLVLKRFPLGRIADHAKYLSYRRRLAAASHRV